MAQYVCGMCHKEVPFNDAELPPKLEQLSAEEYLQVLNGTHTQLAIICESCRAFVNKLEALYGELVH